MEPSDSREPTAAPADQWRAFDWGAGLFGFLPLIVAVAIVAIVATDLNGMLPAAEGDTVRWAVIRAIQWVTFLLAIAGGNHSLHTVANSRDESLRQRLRALAKSATPEILVDAAHSRPSDVVLAFLTWGSRGLLLLGLLGTVHGLGEAVKPIAQTIRQAPALNNAKTAGRKADPGITAREEQVLQQTGEAIGSLGTAFATTAWSVVTSALILLLGMLCAEARARAHEDLAWRILLQEDLLTKAETRRWAGLKKSGQGYEQAAGHFGASVDRFEAAAASIVAMQASVDRSLTALTDTLGTIREDLEQGLKGSSTELAKAASEVSSAGRHLNQGAGKLQKASEQAAAQHADSLKHYKAALDASTADLLAVANTLSAEMGQLPAAVAALPTVLADAATTATQGVFTDLQVSLRALQTYLYWMDQNSNDRAVKEGEAIEQLHGLAETLDRNSQEVVKRQGEQHEKLLQEQHKAIRELVAAHQQAAAAQQQAAAQATAAQQQTAQAAAAQLETNKTLLGAYSKSADELRQGQEQLRQAVVEALEALSSLQTATAAGATQHHQALLKAQTDLTEQIRGFATGLGKAVAPALAEVVRLQTQSVNQAAQSQQELLFALRQSRDAGTRFWQRPRAQAPSEPSQDGASRQGRDGAAKGD